MNLSSVRKSKSFASYTQDAPRPVIVLVHGWGMVPAFILH